MATYELQGQTVRINLSSEAKAERDLVWMKMILEYGHRSITVSNNGLVLEIFLPPSPQLLDVQTMVETVMCTPQHCGA